MSATQSPPIQLDMVGSVLQARMNHAEQMSLHLADRCRQLQAERDAAVDELREARAELAATTAKEGEDHGNG
ncbi:hypothetical protein [Jiella pacifica]|uniref:Uncharacterized protein n=1 Tax=Jiella pacifica TaxID=2696469 RepID=A0A6N9T227_9HYPH|nr:hypothetical protein [Jiella pacifica]NDW04086.1 hypothetical protein [Jiella pacifica]